MKLQLTLCLLAVSFVLPTLSAQTSLDDYAGIWLMQLDQKNFAVLVLKNENGNLTGTLRMPESASWDMGGNIRNIAGEVQTIAITRSVLEQGRLRLVTDDDDWEMTLLSRDQASLQTGALPLVAVDLHKVHGPEVPVVATDWATTRNYSPDDSDASNARMHEIYQADQADHSPQKTAPSKKQWQVIGKRDAQRQAEVRQLLEAGQLHSGRDFEEAAMVFHHGALPNDYLLAHTLAMIALAKGDAQATWIASASLDHYLLSVGKPQIYGTQFDNQGGVRGAFDAGLVPVPLKRRLGVASVDKEKYWLKAIEQQ